MRSRPIHAFPCRFSLCGFLGTLPQQVCFAWQVDASIDASIWERWAVIAISNADRARLFCVREINRAASAVLLS
jgi:hypothetical protein